MAMTPEERREKDAERKRKARAAARAQSETSTPPAADAADAAAPSTEMQTAVAEALAHMKWLKESDGAAIAQAKHLALHIDRYCDAGDEAKMLSAHGRLSRVLHDLGGTPTVRMQHELRSSRKTEGSDGGDESTEGAKPPGNVSKFERPAKRKRS